MRERYGSKPPMGRTLKRALAFGGIAMLAGFVAVITAVTYNPVSHQDFSFVVEDWSTEIEFEVSKPPERTVICELQALSEQFAIVGFKSIEIGPTEVRTTRYRVALNTIQRATTGLVSECRLK